MSKISIECKKIMVEEISSRLTSRNTLIVTNFKGLSSQDLNELRKSLREAQGDYFVVKDSMAKKALTSEPHKRIVEFIEGEVGIVINKQDDPIYISKALVKFSKDHENLQIRGGIMEGVLISKKDVVELASLPSREVLLGKLANVLNSPIQGIASVLNSIICKLVYALNAVKDKKPTETTEKKEEPKELNPETEGKKEESAEKKLEEQKEETKDVPEQKAEEKKPEEEKKQDLGEKKPEDDKKTESQD